MTCEITTLPLDESQMSQLGIVRGTAIYEVAARSKQDAEVYLHRCWQGIRNKWVAMLRETLQTYRVEGIANAGNDFSILYKKTGVLEDDDLYLYVALPEEINSTILTTLGPCASEFYAFFPRLGTDHPSMGSYFVPPEQWAPLDSLGLYPLLRPKGVEITLPSEWLQAPIIYRAMNGDILLLHDNGDIAFYQYAEHNVKYVCHGYEQLLRKLSMLLMYDFDTTSYGDLADL